MVSHILESALDSSWGPTVLPAIGIIVRMNEANNVVFEPEMRLKLCLDFNPPHSSFILLVRLECQGAHSFHRPYHWADNF